VLVICRDLGHREGEATVLNDLGELLARSPASRQARDHYTQALAIARDIGDPLEVARALEGIGRYNLQDANPVEGLAYLQQALTIYEQIGAPYAGRVEEVLREHRAEAAGPTRASDGSRQPGAAAAP
jgi:tetratricopeptide (TPR) repeat protein